MVSLYLGHPVHFLFFMVVTSDKLTRDTYYLLYLVYYMCSFSLQKEKQVMSSGNKPGIFDTEADSSIT